MGRFSGIPTNIQRLFCILIGCIFYGMVQKEVVNTLTRMTLSVFIVSKFSLVYFSNQFNFAFPLSQSHYHNLRQRKKKLNWFEKF